MEIEQFEIEIEKNPDGSGRADYYRVDATGRRYTKSIELTAAQVAMMEYLTIDAEGDDDLPFSDAREVTE